MMIELQTLPGDRIEDTAEKLVRACPARAIFNGVAVRARYATTNPRDIVTQYYRISNERSQREWALFQGLAWFFNGHLLLPRTQK